MGIIFAVFQNFEKLLRDKLLLIRNVILGDIMSKDFLISFDQCHPDLLI